MPDVPNIDIRPDHWEIVQEILRKHVPQHEVWVFGSRAQWTAKEFSDLDLAVITDKPLSLAISASLSDDFSESDLPWKVDVVEWATTSESFRKIIERDKVVVQMVENKGWGMSEWRHSNWGDEVTLEYGKAIRGYSQTQDKYRVFGSNGPIGWTSDALTHGPSVVLGRKGAYRGVEFCREPFWVIDTAYYVAPKTDLDMRWIYYAVKHYKLGEVDDGSPIPSTTRAAVYMLELDVPPKHEQQTISHILGTLDDKIELNRQQNQTLEAMARALFKAWFVDFEPVRAKMEGRWQRGQSLPGLPAHLYDLFPDRLVESELGEIPEGWVIQNVRDIGEIICGKTPSTKVSEYYGDDIAFITIPEMHGNIFAIDINKRLSHAGANSQKNKMLPQGAICVSCIATLGLVVITTEPSQTNQQINSVIPFEKGTTYYWYWVLKNLGDEIKAAASGGSVLGNLSTGRFTELKVSASTEKLRLAYHAMVEGLFSQIMENTRESRSLAQLRDTLLPKLISGELRVPDAEAITGERGI